MENGGQMNRRQRTPMDLGDDAKIYSWFDISGEMHRARRSPYEITIEKTTAICTTCATHYVQESIPTCADNEYLKPHVGIVMANHIVDASLVNGDRLNDLAYAYVKMDSLNICRERDGTYTFSKECSPYQIVPVGKELAPSHCVIFGK